MSCIVPGTRLFLPATGWSRKTRLPYDVTHTVTPTREKFQNDLLDDAERAFTPNSTSLAWTRRQFVEPTIFVSSDTNLHCLGNASRKIIAEGVCGISRVICINLYVVYGMYLLLARATRCAALGHYLARAIMGIAGWDQDQRDEEHKPNHCKNKSLAHP